jgi:LEA14-like dessication related protein
MPFVQTRSLFRTCLIGLLLILGACSSLPPRDPPQIQLVNVEPLPGEGLEMRFAVTLRVQNPNDRAINFNGIALDLKVNNQPLLSGVSDQSGEVPRFGETLVRIPLTLSAYSALRQAWGVSNSQSLQKGLPYELSGKLGGGLLGTVRFNEKGLIDWPQAPVR